MRAYCGATPDLPFLKPSRNAGHVPVNLVDFHASCTNLPLFSQPP